MREEAYERVNKEDLILRDHLAIDRTVLANERTLLAYMRTALAVIISGAFLLKFVQNSMIELLGWLCMPLGMAILIFGIYRFRQVQNSIRRRMS